MATQPRKANRLRSSRELAAEMVRQLLGSRSPSCVVSKELVRLEADVTTAIDRFVGRRA